MCFWSPCRRWGFIVTVDFLRCMKHLCMTPNKRCRLTRLPGSASDWLAPGTHPDAIDGLDPDLVLCPLLQVLDGELSLQAVSDDLRQCPALCACTGVLHPVPHLLCIPVVLPLRQRLHRQRVGGSGYEV